MSKRRQLASAELDCPKHKKHGVFQAFSTLTIISIDITFIQIAGS